MQEELISTLRRAGGIGLITATALSASVGDFHRFPSGVTSPVRSASQHENIPAVPRDVWAA